MLRRPFGSMSTPTDPMTSSSEAWLRHAVATARARSIVQIGFGELRASLVIDRPLTLRGLGTGTHLQGLPGAGSTLRVCARGVVLEAFTIEHLDRDGLAIDADPGCWPRSRDVTILGGRTRGAPAFAPYHPVILDLEGSRPDEPGGYATRNVGALVIGLPVPEGSSR